MVTADLRLVHGTPKRISVFGSRGKNTAITQVYRPNNRARHIAYLAGAALHRRVASRTPYTGSALNELGDFAARNELAVVIHPARTREVVIAKGGGGAGVLAKIGRGSDAELVAREEFLRIAAERLNRSVVLVPAFLESWSTSTGQIVVQSLIEDAKAPRRGRLPDLVLEVALALAAADVTHGDLAPWNLLAVGPVPVLIDWEFASEGHIPALDLTHFFVQAAILGGWWTVEDVFAMLLGPGGPGTRYGRSVGLSSRGLADAVLAHLATPPAASASSVAAANFRSQLATRIKSGTGRGVPTA
jgi:Phosphotransferase enzyme family